MTDEQDLVPKTLATSSDEEEDGVQPDAMRKNFVICIGISKYKQDALNTLGDSCQHDCEDLINILESDFSFERVKGFYGSDGNRNNDKDQVLYNEAATKENIRLLFEHLSYHPDFFVDEGAPELPKHNLVIFYSGHGEAMSNIEKDLFFFVPHDYDGKLDKPDRNKLYSVANGLIPNFDNIRFHSIVLIIDACHSAATFNFSNWFTKPVNANTGNERSVWALCSSAMDKSSFWDTNDRNSFFTKHLLAELNYRAEERIQLELLGIDLTNILRKTRLQNVFSRRLNLIPDNAGDFYFIANEKRRQKLVAIQRKGLLKQNLYRINYSKQEDSIKDWKKRNPLRATPYLFFLSTGPEYGLKIAHRMICYSSSFPVREYWKLIPKRCFLHVIKDLKTDKQSMYELVSNMLDGTSGNMTPGSTGTSTEATKTDDQSLLQQKKAALSAKLLDKLKTAPLILEIIIDQEKIDPQVKQAFLKALLALLSELELKGENIKSFCTIIIDADGENYQEKSDQYAGLPSYFMPAVDDLDEEALTDWYDKVIKDKEDTEIEVYDKLIKDIIDKVKIAVLVNDKCPPGKFIEALCEQCGCKELAIEILKF